MKPKDRHAHSRMMINKVLEAIRDRRSIIRFEKAPIEDEKIRAILEAGR